MVVIKEQLGNRSLVADLDGVIATGHWRGHCCSISGYVAFDFATATCRNGPRRASRPVAAVCCDYLVSCSLYACGESGLRGKCHACTGHTSRSGLTAVEDTPLQICLAHGERQLNALLMLRCIDTNRGGSMRQVSAVRRAVALPRADSRQSLKAVPRQPVELLHEAVYASGIR